MFLKKYSALDDKILSVIRSFVADAAPSEQSVQTFPYEDSVVYLACSDTDNIEEDAAASGSETPFIIGLLAFSPMDEETCEACAYVAPSFRQHGIFANLMKAASETIEDYDILWQVHEDNRTGLAVMDAIEAEMVCENLMMKLPLDDNTLTPLILSNTDAKDLTFDLKEDTYYFLLSDTPVGLCRVVPAGLTHNDEASADEASKHSGTICFYDFEIDKAYRGRGLASAAFELVRKDLESKGWDSIILHVEGDNEPAVRVYRTAGFVITERILSYIY